MKKEINFDFTSLYAHSQKVYNIKPNNFRTIKRKQKIKKIFNL